MVQASAVTEIITAVLAFGQQTGDFHSDGQMSKSISAGRLLTTFTAAAAGMVGRLRSETNGRVEERGKLGKRRGLSRCQAYVPFAVVM